MPQDKPWPWSQPMQRPIRLAVLISGAGTTMVNLAQRITAGTLDAQIVTVIASNALAGGIDKAKAYKLPCHVIARKTFADKHAFSLAIFEKVREAQADLVVLAGFLSLIDIPEDFAFRVVNIHPALLPSFGGAGMYGHHVHEAVIAHGCKVSGCTVHFADATYDTGPILVQRCCPVLPDDTPGSLAARVFEQECEAYPEAIAAFAAGRVEHIARRVLIR
jgi:formyltetrahydrofolate-dependent phosphoribosylglycinamide formyltransferase